MKVMEAMGNYTVRTDDNKVVLSSAASTDSPFYCSAEKLAPHIGHTLVCVIYGDEDAVTNISIECEECEEALFSLDAPGLDAHPGEDDSTTSASGEDEALGGYDYDDPDDKEAC